MDKEMDENENIARLAVCDNCAKPNLLWQPWREMFRCGWCKKDYSKEAAEKLCKLSEESYGDIYKKRKHIINSVDKDNDKAKGGD